MLTNKLRRGGAWRFVALGLFATSILAPFAPTGGNDAQAHTGTPGTLCGSVSTIAATYLGQYTIYAAPYYYHYHEWEFPGGEYHPELCGVLW